MHTGRSPEHLTLRRLHTNVSMQQYRRMTLANLQLAHA